MRSIMIFKIKKTYKENTMKYTKIRENLKHKEKIEITKIKLLAYGKSLKLIDDISIEMNKTKSFNKMCSLEDEIKDILLDYEKISNTISKLDDLSESIIFTLWVFDGYNSDNDIIRKLSSEYNLSEDKILEKSDKALLTIYKNLYKN